LNKFLIILFGVLIISCSKNEIHPLATTNDLEVIDTTVIKDGCYYTAFIYDSLLVLTSNCDDYIFHIYDKQTLKFIKKFGTKGRGPYEFNLPFPNRTNTTTDNADSIFCFFDLNIPRLSSINFTDIVHNEEIPESMTTEDQDIDLFACDMLNKLSENKIVGHDVNIGSADGMFFIYDRNTQKKKWIDYIPNYNIAPEYRWQAYYGEVYSNTKIIIFAARYFDEVLFFDTDGKLIHEYYFSEILKPSLNKQDLIIDYKSSFLYTINIYGTKDYCYIIRVARPATDIIEARKSPVKLLIFNWKGDLANVCTIESIPVCFCVDEYTNVLYLIMNEDKTNDSVKIVRYHMNTT